MEETQKEFDQKEDAIVRTADATAEVFMTAFESLPKSEREAIMQRLFANPALTEDLIDVATWYDRRAERAIPYQRVRQRLKKADRL
ncbi:MAG: hypothetical protein Q8N04_09655 [Nitrospira sp.]|nr:hypothetical protein [Nitrospira sp.]